MNHTTVQKPMMPQTVPADARLDVRQRLDQLAAWQAAWEQEDALLAQRVRQLNPNCWLDLQRGVQIASLRRRLRLQLVQQPLEIAADVVRSVGYTTLRQHLVEQFAGLSKAERHLWLHNFSFIVTPDLRRLNDKIEQVRAYRSLGQQRNFLLGGPSGMGKTTYLDWLALHQRPTVEADRNHVPIVKIDAPVSNNTPKPLFQRILHECGASYTAVDHEEILLMKLVLYFQCCGVETLIVDESSNITRTAIRRRLLEISNMTRGVPHDLCFLPPLRWIEGDARCKAAGTTTLNCASTRQRLSQLLAFLELLLPLPPILCWPTMPSSPVPNRRRRWPDRRS